MKKLVFLAAFASLAFATQAKAGLMLEPYAGYEMETSSATDISGNDDSGTGTAISAGLRLGYHTMGGFWIAADGQFGFSGTETPKAGGATDKYTRQQIYADLGYDWPRLFRVWAGYAVSNQLVDTDSSGADSTFTGGTAWKVGIGFKLAHHCTLGVEYHDNAYSQVKDSTGTYDVSQVFPTFTDNVTMVVLSFPLMM